MTTAVAGAVSCACFLLRSECSPIIIACHKPFLLDFIKVPHSVRSERLGSVKKTIRYRNDANRGRHLRSSRILTVISRC